MVKVVIWLIKLVSAKTIAEGEILVGQSSQLEWL